MKPIVYFIICSLTMSCSINKKLIRELYRYEKNQFAESKTPRNVRALNIWKSNHEYIFRNRRICNSFILTEWFDSSKRKGQYIKKIDYYGSEYKMCGDTGYVFNTIDSVILVRTSYKKMELDLLEKSIYDSITKNEVISVETSNPHEPIRIIQVIKVKGRKIEISGFNLNSRLKVQKKI
jgi:hypothetical protein